MASQRRRRADEAINATPSGGGQGYEQDHRPFEALVYMIESIVNGSGRYGQAGDMMDITDIIDILAIPLLGVVPDDEGIIVSTNRGEPVVLNGRCRSGEAFGNIVRRLEGEEVPFLDLRGDGIFEKLKRLVGLR